MKLTHFTVVIAREGGVSSTPRRRFLSSAPAITESSATVRSAHKADDDAEQEV
jgi:hypothetical protein